MNLNAQGLQAQADLLRRLGYEADARAVEAGDVEFDPDALECLDPRPGFEPQVLKPGDLAPHPDLIMEPEREAEL
jgi:hypothetical protein